MEYIAATLKAVAAEVLGDKMLEDIERLLQHIRETALDEVQIHEYPFVTFRTNVNTWVEATLVYLVSLRRASAIRSEILKKGIKALLQESDRVLFPKGENR